MSLESSNIPRFGKKFFEDIDQYISERYDKLTCNDIFNIYFQFFMDMKMFKGNSNGFTGLSEYLIFRSVYHLLGGSFKPVQISKDLYEFVSNTNQNLRLSQSVRVDKTILGKKRLYPDIGISHSNELLAVCQIKIYLTQGIKELNAELEKLDFLKNFYSDLQALLLIFGAYSAKGPMIDTLKKKASERQWFQYHFLRGNNRLLVDVFKEGLKLDRKGIS